MKTIIFLDNGDGVAKTSLVYHLAWMYARLGVNVLAADLNPQAKLTGMFLGDDDLEPLWSETGERRTFYGALRPLLDGADDMPVPYVAEPEPGLGLVVGDLLLATMEEELGSHWAACLEGQARAFHVLSSLARILRRGAAEVDARLILVDVGSHLGAFNRAALVTADSVVVPLAPDLYSLHGLPNLGSTLRRWHVEWKERRERSPVEGLSVPEGAMRPIGYVVMRDAVRLDRPVKASGDWMNRIPAVYRTAVVGEKSPTADATVETDPHCLATLKPYASLMPLAQEARKPMFALKPADGAIGGHVAAVQGCYRDYRALARAIARRAGSPLDDAQSDHASPGPPSRPKRPVTITFRPMRPVPDPPPADGNFTPERMADLARGLEETIAKIEKWGIAVRVGSRLPKTVKLLQDVAFAGSFPKSQAELKQIAHAASDAQELILVRGMLPPDPLDSTVTILRRAIGGTLGVTLHEEAYQAQSELWVGAALSCAGVRLGVLTKPEGPSPDYVVWNGASEYAIEVKRLAGDSSVKRRVSEAANQTRSSRYHGGALYVDLTDWLPSDTTLRFASGPPDLNSPQMPIARKIDRLRKEIFDDQMQQIRQRRVNLFAVTAFARFIHWDLTDLSQMYLSRYIAPLWFWHSAKDLRYHRARWLAELLHNGARNIGLQDLGAHEISFENPAG